MPESETSSVLKGQTPSTGLRTVPESEPSSVTKGPNSKYWFTDGAGK